jgi:quinol monooxygenase YgiN
MPVILKMDLYAKPGKAQELVTANLELLQQYPVIDGYHGDARLAVDPGNPNHILTVETWDSAEQHQAWVESARAAIDATVMPIIESSSSVEYWPIVWPE